MRNLALEIDNGSGYQWAWLGDDASVTVENVNPIFDTDAGGTFTHSISLDVARNSHIFGAAADFRGPRIFNLLRKKKARLWIMGYPVTGIIRMDSELSVEDGKVEIEIASNSKELSDLLSGVNCQDVDISDDNIFLGFALPEYMEITMELQPVIGATVVNQDGSAIVVGAQTSTNCMKCDSTYQHVHQVALPKTLFPTFKTDTNRSYLSLYEYGNFDHTNVHYPYSQGSTYSKTNPATYPYCNIRACYQKYENVSENGSSKWTEKRGSAWREPTDINSAPCFYVAYWFHKLWQQLGITIESDSLAEISDFNRIAFLHFNPEFDFGSNTGLDFFGDMTDNEKEENRFTLEAAYSVATDITGGGSGIATVSVPAQVVTTDGISSIVRVTDATELDNWSKGLITYNGSKYPFVQYGVYATSTPTTSAILYTAIANSKNFPDTDADNVLNSMEAAFGARYIYDSSQASMRVVLIRDILRQTATLELPCLVKDVSKTEPGVIGFRLKYDGSESATYNGITKVDEITGANEQYDADTTYNYTDWTNVIFITESSNSESALASLNITNRERKVSIPNYLTLINYIANSDKTCYVSVTTGNSYRIKVDADAEDETTLYPSLFEVGALQDWTEGDCSHEAEDDGLIEEVTIPFTPAISNDVNIQNEKDAYIYGRENYGQKFAQLLDGEIHTKKTTRGTNNVTHTEVYDYQNLIIATGYALMSDTSVDLGWSLQESTICSTDLTLTIGALETYDISNDGPYYEYDNSSIILGIMRGSGSSAKINYSNKNYDLEDGEIWDEMSGSDPEFTLDSIDDYGRTFYYSSSGTDTDFSMSLKLRSEKENPGYSAYAKANAAELYTSYKKENGDDSGSSGSGGSSSGGTTTQEVTYGNITYALVTITKDKAYSYFSKYFSRSHAQLSNGKRRTVTGQDLKDAGWTYHTYMHQQSAIDASALYPYGLTIYEYPDEDGVTKYVLVATVMNDGTVAAYRDSTDEYGRTVGGMGTYMSYGVTTDNGKTVGTPDDLYSTFDPLATHSEDSTSGKAVRWGEIKNVIVDIYDNKDVANAYSNFLQDLGHLYFGSDETATVHFPKTVLGDYDDYGNQDNLIDDSTVTKDSEKFKYNGYYYTSDGSQVFLDNGTLVPNTRFFPVSGSHAGRGLGDKFYKEYAYWVLNRKILDMDVEASAAVLTGIDFTKRYRVGGVEGFIKQYSYSVSMKSGISSARIELYYI